MPKPWYSIKASADESAPAEVYILEPISAWYGVDAKSYLDAFRAIKSPKVKLYINSPGGDVMQGLAIFNGMRASGKEIEVHVLGIAASIASYIAMAGDKVVMPANTLMLLHNPMTGVFGNAEELREAADTLEKVQNVVTATYGKRWKGDEKALADMLAAETLLTAAECLEHGFCDEVVDEIEATASFDMETLPPAARKVFEAAKAKSDPPPAPVTVPESIVEQVKAIVAQAGLEAFMATVVTDPEATTIEGAQAVVARVRDIHMLAGLTGLVEQGAALIRERKTVAEARVALASVLAEKDAATRVDTALPANPQKPQKPTQFNPTQVWAEIEANKTRSYAK